MTPSSLKSARSNNSSASQRRILEARAAKELAEIDLRKLEVERTLVEARLAEETALLEEDAASHVSAVSEAEKSVQVQKWVDETCNAETCEVKADNKQERGHQDYRTAVNDYRSGHDNDIANLTRAITEAVNKTTTTNSTPTTDKLLGRMSAKDLPTFTGDPIEWLRFKNIYQSTTRIGQYSDEENVARLQRCLHGPAWEAVAARLITVTSADEIIKTLEMRFGRPDLVLHRLISEVRKIPKLTGVRTDLVSLATKVDNCVAAIESMDHIGYLYSPDLMTMIIDKMTEPIFFRWLDYSKGLTTRDPQLPALAKYLMEEAHEICLRRALESAPTKTIGTKRSILLTNVGEEESHPEPDKESTNVVVPKTTCKTPTEKECAFCSDKGHGITICPKFADEDINQRWDWTCKRRLCFRCLKSTHRRERCKSKVRCKTCKRGHHSLLHRLDWDKPETTANTWSVKNKVFLKVLPVEIEGPSGSVTTYALLDEGSTVSLIESDIAEKIGASGPEKELKIHGVVGLTSSASSQMVTLTIRTPWGLHQLDRVRTVKALNLPYHTIPKEQIESLDHLKDLPLYAFEGQPAMLIGQDQWPLIVSRELREGGKGEPVASLTKLGWVLHGVCSSIASNIMPEFALHGRLDEDDRLDELVRNYFHLDSLGVKCLDRPRLSPDEKRAIHILDTKSRKIGKRWETGLLWRSDDVQLPDNRRNAEHRLRSTERMMDADPIAAADYEKQVVNFIEKGYAKEAQEKPTGRVWYLPHFGVRNPNKPGKLRLVFDAKATTNGISLNTELLTGPDLLNNLLGVLLRFRERAVAVTADIREMFLQVKINADDQNAQCFLWRGMERKQPPRIYKMTSMTFGATSSPCTATYIIRRNADEYASSHPRAVEAIKKRHYVDDYLDSLDDEEEMKRLVEDIVMIHKTGGFDIRGWASNRPNVLPKEAKTEPVMLLGRDDEVQRTLGLNWRPSLDTLGFDLSMKKIDKDIANGVRIPTKRQMLQVVMSVFDPLGILSPFLIRGRIMLQELWWTKTKWDEQIKDDLAQVWIKWLQDLKKCRLFSMPRHYGFSAMDKFQLIIFVDASEQAYAAVAYLRRDTQIAFVAGKSRVAPLKAGTTIPRLELQAALLGARLGETIKQEQSVTISQCIYWTDSLTVWRWIRNNPRKINVFVSNRLSEIDELTKPEEWRWLPGNMNVADEATRANVVLDMDKSRWVSGPDFLHLSEDAWPKFKPAENEEEIEPPTTILTVSEAIVLIDHTRFSNWRRLTRSFAYVLLFIDRCQRLDTRMSPVYERRSQTHIIRQTQCELFYDEIAAIKNGNTIKPQSKLRKLNPRLDDDGVLRVQSRLIAGRELSLELKKPIILDARHNVTKLIIEYKHRLLGHFGTATLVNELRQDYYIFRLRAAVRSLIANCVICKARRARCEQPMMAGLPTMRLEHHCRPFTYCGVDMFGPMTVTIGRRQEKRWGVIFTCMNTRAVHIEIASSLNTDSTLMAIRRMAARRGYPKRLHSDNGTNFRSANKELLKIDEDVINRTADLGIEWTFNPPDAPHMGGVWERLIRSVKTALSAILHSRAPKEEVLITLMAEAENVVNSRPLTDVSLDPDEEEALTPNHFLLGSSNGLGRPGSFTDADLNLRRQWRISQRLADHFWSRWMREYLPSLQTRTRWTRDDGCGVGLNDLVLIADSSSPRNVWPRGRVVATLPGRDSRVRMVDVATRGGAVLRRPVNKLVVLIKAVGPAATV